MPRYFFSRTDGLVDHDVDGTELQDLHAARVAAVVFAAESLRDRPEYVSAGDDFRVEVMEEGGQLVFTVLTTAINTVAGTDDLGRAAT